MGQFIVVDPESKLLELTPTTTDVTIRWSKNLGAGVFDLQTAPALGTGFSDVLTVPSVVNDMNQVIWSVDQDFRFFRLVPSN